MHIEIRDLEKLYPGGMHALRGVTLGIEPGMFGLLGPNGAGKTTLMRILAGILRPSHGTVRVGAWDLATEQDRLAVKRVLGYLPQELGLYPDLRAREFLDYIAVLKGLDDKAARRRRVADLLETVGLANAAGRTIKTLSGGMKRRLGIAQALLNSPRLLIVDEPTAGLDPEERIHFRNLLSDLAGDSTVVLSTHIVEDIAQTALRVAVMMEGQVIFQGTTLEVVEGVRGHVWTVTATDGKPQGDVSVVSTLNLGTAMQYRVVGQPAETEDATPAQPSLEDGYVWLMREHRRGVGASV
jgi:ABC-type multidrug transport system ATPase subunit